MVSRSSTSTPQGSSRAGGASRMPAPSRGSPSQHGFERPAGSFPVRKPGSGRSRARLRRRRRWPTRTSAGGRTATRRRTFCPPALRQWSAMGEGECNQRPCPSLGTRRCQRGVNLTGIRVEAPDGQGPDCGRAPPTVDHGEALDEAGEHQLASMRPAGAEAEVGPSRSPVMLSGRPNVDASGPAKAGRSRWRRPGGIITTSTGGHLCPSKSMVLHDVAVANCKPASRSGYLLHGRGGHGGGRSTAGLFLRGGRINAASRCRSCCGGQEPAKKSKVTVETARRPRGPSRRHTWQ